MAIFSAHYYVHNGYYLFINSGVRRGLIKNNVFLYLQDIYTNICLLSNAQNKKNRT
jgi:hypothetical protein